MAHAGLTHTTVALFQSRNGVGSSRCEMSCHPELQGIRVSRAKEVSGHRGDGSANGRQVGSIKMERMLTVVRDVRHFGSRDLHPQAWSLRS